ncbi:hypothetical protein [Gloeothece verrucosa]|uniref:Uncharacterized protein n=1 Tax=Gloeothece verrucosa (strain PCC 7822) TaxID=497965 RepID=E0UFE9_GLOV7|nr:hypothetical protein [Gloeothece verrucosa]ADN16643.1 hypothetical protein Cyan7822_4740 [Gloeothece verrucosa PCC 7822]
MKDLIMGYATNSKFDDFYRFVVSIRQHCHPDKVDVVVFINALGNEFAKVAVEHNITLIPVENVWKWVTSSKLLNLVYYAKILGLQVLMRLSSGADRVSLENDYRHTLAHWIHPIVGRWFAYHTFLKVNSSYRMVMTSDVRDVIFQASPFHNLDSTKLHVFEQASRYYGQKNLDSQWFSMVYGKKGLEEVAGKAALCAGTILGENALMTQLIELMTLETQFHPRNIIDQAVFNKVINHDFPSNQVVRHNLKSGSVLTLCADHKEAWEIQDDKVIVDGRIAPVIHMYDRDPQTNQLFLSKIPIPQY